MSEKNEDKIDGLVRSLKSVCETLGSFDQRLKILESGDGTHGSSLGSSMRVVSFDHNLYSPTGPNRCQ